MTCRDHEVVAK